MARIDSASETKHTSDRFDFYRQLFDRFYLHLYSYMKSRLGGRVPEPDLVAEAFAAALRGGLPVSESEFGLRLFRSAYGLLDGRKLVGIEREQALLALIFDGGLTPDEAAQIMDVSASQGNTILISGLRLRAALGDAAAA